MQPEILAPVGSRASLEAAFAAGANALYFGLPQFGARAYANRFTLEETKEIIERAHLMNVKVYITMNTILFEDEIEEAYEQAKA
ncbi:peptidase U32 family protein, partial [Dubosiella newyorkensis]